MKAIQFSSFGKASAVAELVDIALCASPCEGEVMVRLWMTPINPSDLLHFAGRYSSPAELPSFAGGAVLGKVVELGKGVNHLSVDDVVIAVNTLRSGWQELGIYKAQSLRALPKAEPAAMSLMAANPPTALLMLENFCQIQKEDWIIQNAANSSVGVSIIQLARTKGFRTINVVRRADLVTTLQEMGGDIVLVDGDDLADRVRSLVGSDRIPLGIDAVAGAACGRLASCLTRDGTVINYGLLSGDSCQISSSDVLFRNIQLKGFWYADWVKRAEPNQVKNLFDRLINLFETGKLKIPIEKVYPLDLYRLAFAHAEKEGRLGKIVMNWDA